MTFTSLVQSAFDSLFAQSAITASAVLGNYLVLGTKIGEVYVLLLSGNQKQRYRAFEGKEVTSLSLTIDGHLSILCTGRDEDAVVSCGCYQEDLRLGTIRFSESVNVVCYNSKAREGSANSFLVGTISGKVLLHRANFLFGKKELVLQDNYSRGGNSNGCIMALAWRGDLAAWADGSGVAVFDVSTMTAVARIALGPPVADLPSYSSNALSSVLCWMSERRLLLAWGCAVRCYAVGIFDDSVVLFSSYCDRISHRFAARQKKDWLTLINAAPLSDHLLPLNHSLKATAVSSSLYCGRRVDGTQTVD